MCTVTFIPARDHFFLTSNRDEKKLRNSMPPARHYQDNATLIYPKDPTGGGTWIALHENGNAAVLLNGAFIKHMPAPPYAKSRGIVLLDLMGMPSPQEAFSRSALDNIEPFTLILVDEGNLYECRWDGRHKHLQLLDNRKPHIWSSATLYEQAVAEKRSHWFNTWVNKHPVPVIADVLQFHLSAGDGDTTNDLRMTRDNSLMTLSITGIEVNSEKAVMYYRDLVADKNYLLETALYSPSSPLPE